MASGKTTRSGRPLGDRSWLIHGGQQRSRFDETCEAIYQTSGFVYRSAAEAAEAFAGDGVRFVYSRYRNPTVGMLEDRLAGYEGAAAGFATASGMAAVFAALMASVRAGGRVVAPYALFGSCLYILTEILPRYGVETVLVDGTDLAAWQQALARPTSAVFLETPTNPCLDVIDIARVATLAHAAGARVIVDNVFATPVLQKPMVLGADIVVYSATKHIDGQGRCLGGVVLCGPAEAESVRSFLRHTGPALSPFNAWMLLKGLETLELRVAAQMGSAARVAAALDGAPGVKRVRYPGLESHPQHALARRQMAGGGTLVAFDLEGGHDAAFRLLDRLELILISNNLGDTKSLATHPATTTHQRLSEAERTRVGIGPGTVRLSVGLEQTDDLIADLRHALGA